QALAGLPAEISRLTGTVDRLTAGADRLAVGTRESEQGALQLSAGLQTLSAAGHTLEGGMGTLDGGAGELEGGLVGLEAGDRRLAGGLGKLSAGNGRLADGLGPLAAGGEKLAGGLSGGVGSSGRLASGLARTQGPLRSYATMLAAYERDYRLLHGDAPNALDSGYLVLTALDGTVSPMREQVAQLVNVDSGGQAARMVVVASSAPGSPATAALSRKLRASLPSLAAATGSRVEIGQGAQYLLDYKNANTARVPWLVAALALVATLTLVVVLRAVQFLTERHVLGGPGYVDAASGAGILAIMFVLSIDYEVFLLTRMREH